MRLQKVLLLSARLSVLGAQLARATLFPPKAIEIKENCEFDKNKHQFICIIATYQKKLDKFTYNFLLNFKRRGGFIVLSANHQKMNFIDLPKDCVDVFIKNENFGRDVGAYKSATLFIYKKLKGDLPEKIIYCNDSVFFIDRKDDSWLEQLLDTNYDFIGTFENPSAEEIRQPWFISSWLFSVSRGLFESSQYIEFFRSFKPVNNKRFLVKSGEIRLSKVALSYSKRVKSIYSNKYLLNEFKQYAKKVGHEKAASILPRSIREDYEAKYKRPANSNHFIDHVCRNFYRFSPTHIFTMFLLQQTKFPFIKKDLFWSGWVGFDQLGTLDKIMYKIFSDEVSDLDSYYQIKAYFRLRSKWVDEPFSGRLQVILGLK